MLESDTTVATPAATDTPDGDALHFNLLKPPPVKRVEPDPPWFTVGEETDIVVTNYSESKPGVGKVITLHIGVKDTKRHDGKTFEDEIPDDTQTLIITVINTPPRFTEMDPVREVAENVPLGTNVGTPLEVQNLEGDTLVWEISGSDFTVDESGQDELVRWPSFIAAVMDVPDAIESSYEADAKLQGVLRRLPGHQHPPIARITVDTGAQTQAHDGVSNRGHRRPGQTEPDGGKDQGKQHEGRAVGHEDEASNPDAMTMEAVTKVMSTALRASIQRRVTGLFVSSRKWTNPLSATSVTCRNTYYR